MKPRTLMSTTAALTALVLGGTTGTAAAAASTAVGSAASSLSLLTVQAGGHSLGIGTVSMASSTLTGSPVANLTITPAVVDGTSYGARTVTPADSPVAVASLSTPAALAGLVSLASPAFTATATNAPSTSAGTTGLGSLKLLGMTVPLNGTLDLGSAVSSTTGALASKTVSVTNLNLPSIADILAALGLDLSALPIGTLSSLVDGLDLANATIDTAQAALTSATSDLAAKTASLTSATTTLTSATSTLTGLLAQVNTSSFPGANTLTGYLGLSDPTAVNSSVAGLASASAAYDAAKAAVATAQGLVDTAQALVTSTTSTLLAAIDAVLDGTPLVSVGGLTVSTKAAVTSAKAGGQTANITGGEITGLKVLGTDVLQAALGSSTLNAVDLVGATATSVTSAIAGVTSTLSSVLSTVPGLAGLSVPAPQVSLLTKTVGTSISGGFGKANTALTGLRITLPAITLPTSVALPGAVNLPALQGVTQVAGALTSAPVRLDLVTLAEQSAFAPAVTTVGTPGTPGSLPRTGLPVGVAALAMMALGGALVLRRRAAQQ